MATTKAALGKKGLINFDFLQKLGKVLMTVIAVMPAAGLMISLGKLVQIVSDAHYTLDYLKVLTPEDLLITVSATGNFATLMEPMVQKAAAYKVLVTVNHAIKMWKSYDQVIYLSEKDNSGARTVYSQYGMTYFFDILYSYYVNKYRETDLLQGPISELPLSDSQKMRVQRCAE